MISNGEEFFEIPAGDLAAARHDGFYLPREKGNTIVAKGDEVFEIPLSDLPEALQDGFRDLTPARPTRRQKQPAPTQFAGLPDSTTVDAGRLALATTELAAVLEAVQIETGHGEEPVETAPVEVETEEVEPEALSPDEVEVQDEPDEEIEIRQELEQRYEEAVGWEKFKLWLQLNAPTINDVQQFGRSYGVSTALHLVLLIILSFVIFQTDDKAKGGAVISSTVGNEDPTPQDESQEVVIEEADDSQNAEAADTAGDITDTLGAADALASAIDPGAIGGGLKGLSESLGEGLDKMSGTGEKISASFFGSKTTASTFVFCIDNSNSMTRGKFETALDQLAKTITKLGPQQRFYIIFYSDTAYPLFWPRPVKDLIPATPRNKTATLNWLGSVELCLKTKGREAMELAISLDPDVIYVLGDGAFTDDAAKFMAAQKLDGTVVHTLGMEVRDKDAAQFESIAKTHGGTYHDVGIDPRGAEMAKRAPRKKNNKRGPVWGVGL